MSPVSSSEPTPPGERVEWQYQPHAGSASRLSLALGMLGYAALGAGVYGAWLAPQPVAAAWPLLLGGVVAILASSLVSPKPQPPVRVGELGVIVGDPAEAERLHWYELSAVRIVGDDLRLESSRGPVLLPLAAHASAAARIVAEASQRVAERVDISPKAHERLPRISEAAGQRVPAARLQLAGRKCAATGASITFESDARLCPSCAALYHVEHVPAKCLRCGHALHADASPPASRAAS